MNESPLRARSLVPRIDQGMATVCERKPLVSCELEQLAATLNEHEEALAQLLGRLQDSVTPDRPQELCKQQPPCDVAILPVIGNKIRDNRERLSILTRNIRDILSRLEV